MNSKLTKTLKIVLFASIMLCLTGIILLLCVSSALSQKAEAVMGFSTSEKPFAGGDGSEENPYLIANAYHLNNVRYFFYHRNEDGTSDTTQANCFLQIADVDAALQDFSDKSEANFEPIGSSSDPFPGIYEGNGYSIKNIKISSSEQNVGLFGATSSSAKIYRVALKNSTISASSANVGGIVGQNAGTIDQSYSLATISGGTGFVGGLVGTNSGTLKNSYNAGTLSGTKTGGVAGQNTGIVSGCYNAGTLGTQKGGIAHTNSGSLSRVAYLSTNASAAVYGGADSGTIKGVSANQLSGKEQFSIDGTAMTTVQLLNDKNTTSMSSYFYGTNSTCTYPQIWTNAQDDNFRLLGEGTTSSPYLVTSPQVFALIGQSISLGELKTLSFGSADNFVQPVDLNFLGVDTNYATGGNFSQISEFSGKYSTKSSSRCAVIEGIEFASNATSMSLFGTISSGASVSGIEVKNFTFDIQTSTPFNYSAIANTNNGTINNCVNSVAVQHQLSESQIATTNIAGIAISNAGTISNCANLATLDVYYPATASGATSFVAGIAATSSGIIDSCYNSSYIRGGQTGGIVVILDASGTISNSFNSGEIVATFVLSGSDVWGGGLVCNAVAGSQISNSYNVGKACFGIAVVYNTITNVYYLSGVASLNKYGGDSSLTLNANQLAGQTVASGSSKILDILGSNWEFDWTYLGRDGVAYQFPQLKNNKAEYHLSTAMKVDAKGFHEVENSAMFEGVCKTYNGISYPSDGWFSLLCDADCNGSSYNEKGEFSGKLYGNGHTISNASVNRSSTSANGKLGFFSQIHGTATIKDLTLNNMTFKNKSNDADSSNGVLAGKISHGATISNVIVQNGYIRAKNNIGGLAGAIASTGSDGAGNGSVTGCRVINTQIRHDDDAGGSDGSPTGGFVGWAKDANISACYYAHDNTSGGEDDAGIFGYYKMGGFVGITEGATSITNCFAYGATWCNRSIAATSSSNRASVGGFVGRNESSTVNISNCYARMTMTKDGGVSSSKRIRGFGFNTGGGTFSNNYCLSGQQYKEDEAGATEVSESALKTQSTFSGWDFTNVWTMSSTSSLPYGMPIPILAQTSPTQNATLVVTTDGNSKIQAFSGSTLVGETTSSSSGMGILELGAGSYSIYITRNGQTALTASNVSNYASLGIEKVDVSLVAGQTYSHQNKWFASGSGTEGSPYLVSTSAQLQKLNNFAGVGENTYFVLRNNIDFEGATISSIKDFRGTLDGNGNVVTNFVVSTSESAGLFASVNNATLQNIGVRNYKITNSSSSFSGGLVGEATNSQIISCFAENGEMTVVSNAGGLVGKLSGGKISYSYSNSSISSSASSSNVGGLVGSALGSAVIEESYADGKIQGQAKLGGFVASLENATIKNCYSKTYINSSYSGSSAEVGGFAGTISSSVTIQNSFMFGTLASTNSIAMGNFAGTNSSANLTGVYYWNNNAYGACGTGTSSSISPLSTIEFKQASSFGEYDFIDIWGMPSTNSVASGSPILRRVANAFDINEQIMGSGTELDPYVIFDEQTLIDVKEMVAENADTSLCFKLQKDITLSSSWTGIGTSAAPFVGVFDGNGKTISGLDGQALFAYTKNATIKNLTVTNAQISSTSTNVGAVVNEAENTNFLGVVVSGGQVSSSGSVGALAGKLTGGLVKESKANGVTLTGANVGLVGEASGVEFVGDSVSGITATGTQNAGSFVGLLTNGTIHNLSVSSNTLSAPNIGGIVGTASSSTIHNVVVNAFNFSNATNIGGVAGVLNSSVIGGANMFVSSLSSTGSTGAVAGMASSSTLNNNTVNTQWSSTSTLSGQNVGGIVGHAQNMTQMAGNRICSLTLTPSSSSGAVGQLYGKLTGSANASKTLYKDITISNSVGATSNALGGVDKNETDVVDGSVVSVTWKYVE